MEEDESYALLDNERVRALATEMLKTRGWKGYESYGEVCEMEERSVLILTFYT